MATQLATTDQQSVVALSSEAEKFSLMQRQAQLFASSPLIPQHLRNGTPQQAMANCYIAMTIADKMGEDRMTVMQNIHIVHGTAGFKASYMIARANSSGKFKDSIDWEVSGKGKDLSATAFATLASTGRRIEFTVDMAMAEAEGWTKNSKYRTLPELMLRYRSGTFLVRLYAPEVMLGYQTAEEVEDVTFAAGPTAEPLTSKMLIDQSRGAEPVIDLPAHDGTTGELIDEQNTQEGSGTAREAPGATESTVAESVTDGPSNFADDDSPDPRTAAADAIIAEIEEQGAIIDVNSVAGRHSDAIKAMPDDLAAKVNEAVERRKAEIKAKRETVQEPAE